MSLTVAYLDASAAAKLLLREPETAALRAALGGPLGRVSSAVLAVELHCLAQRQNAATSADVDTLLASIDLLDPVPPHLARAAEPFTPPQRALDAIHLAAALSLGIRGLGFVTYDERQAQAAQAEGLTVLSPA